MRVSTTYRQTSFISATTLLASTLTLFTTTHAVPQRPISHRHAARAVPSLSMEAVYTTQVEDVLTKSYEYVVVGGGNAGLVVAARLAEASHSVVVIEAGNSGDDAMERILPPAIAYINGIAGPTSDYDWHFYTANQTSLGNRPIYWPRGKLLGGSSAVNGVYLTRASRKEHDVWAALNNASEWDWDTMNEYYKKHESFAAPTAEFAQSAGGVAVDADAHGSSGPVHYARGGYLYAQIGAWIPTWASLGVGTKDPAAGDTTGAYLSTSAIKTDDQTRSYSRPAYVPTKRNNLDILTGFQVTKVNFETTSAGTVATGISLQSGPGGDTYTLMAGEEVILSAGVIGSPHILQLSGVGPADLLQSNGIQVVQDLPGVGAHLQDHLSSSVTFSSLADVTGDLLYTDSSFNASHWDLWTSGQGNSSVYSAPNNAIAYLNITTLMGEAGARAFIASSRDQLDAYVQQEGLSGTVEAGYRTLFAAEVREFLEGGEGAAEFLMTNTGYGRGASGKTTTLQFATQRPFSRGALRITSGDPFTMPSINPGYLTHPADIAIVREAMKYIRNVAATAPLSALLGAEIAPGAAEVSTDEQIEAFARERLSTEYHPAGSCSMLPLQLGGCVDAQARVHGIRNLRVIDSSIIPVSMAAHLMSPTYALAERAVDLILGKTTAAGTSSTDSASPSAGSDSSNSPLDGENSDTGASLRVKSSSTCAMIAASAAFLAVLQV